MAAVKLHILPPLPTGKMPPRHHAPIVPAMVREVPELVGIDRGTVGGPGDAHKHCEESLPSATFGRRGPADVFDQACGGCHRDDHACEFLHSCEKLFLQTDQQGVCMV